MGQSGRRRRAAACKLRLAGRRGAAAAANGLGARELVAWNQPTPPPFAKHIHHTNTLNTHQRPPRFVKVTLGAHARKSRVVCRSRFPMWQQR